MSTLPPPKERSARGAHARTRSSGSPTSPLLFAGSLVARSLVLAGLATTALLVALAAWFGLKAALRVDPVIGRERVWLQYGHFRPPYAVVRLEDGKYSVPGRAYDVSVEASVPVNDNNLELGNFMVALSLLDNAGNRVVNASRPALLAPAECLPQPAPAPKSLFHLPSLLTLPFTLLPIPRLPSFFGSTSLLPSRCAPLQTLNIPLLESTSFVSPVPSSSLGWLRPRRASRTPRGAGPVKSVWVEIGRRDAHPHHEAFDLASVEDGNMAEQAVVARRARADEDGRRERVRELQVHESWLRIEVKPTGLRALIHYHPYLAFLFFVPSFLLFEALAALAVWAWWVATSGASRPASPTTPAGEWWTAQHGRVAAESEEEEEVKPLLTPSEGTTEGEDEEEKASRIRMRLGRGGVGMSALDLEGEEEDLESLGGAVSAREEVEEVEESPRARVKEEEEPEFGETGTLAGSATTRRTASTFGPSLAPTTATTASSRTTALSSAGLRGRTVGGNAEDG